MREVAAVKKQARKGLSILLAGGCLFSLMMLARVWCDGKRGSNANISAQQIAMQPVEQPSEKLPQTQESLPAQAETLPLEPRWFPAQVQDDPQMTELAAINLDALRQVNPHVVGWIRIPGTGIDFPVVQGEDNAFYLDHSWDKSPNQYGSIFLECMNDPKMEEFNTIIYGHRMNDGSMFAPLLDYAREDFLRAHPYIYLVTDAAVLRYQVFSSYTADVDSDAYGLGMQLEHTKREYIADAIENSDVDTGILPAFTDRILTLSTCTRGSFESRRVVHAYLPMVFENP